MHNKIKWLIKVAKISKSQYYYINSRLLKEDKNQHIINKITEIFYKNNRNYGYRRITMALRNEGLVVNHKKVKSIMSKLSLYGKQSKRKYNSYKGNVGKVAPNVLQRNFKVNKFLSVWVSDVSQFKVGNSWLYFSPILDLYNNEIISYAISKSPNFEQITTMLELGFKKYKNLKGLVFHTDQGWQYQMKQFSKILKNMGIIQSMSRKGNCLDNSVMENFFGIMKNEMFYNENKEYKSYEELEQAIISYIDYYNNVRIKIKLKGMSPVNYRKHSSNMK